MIETMALLFQLLGDPAFDGLATWYNGPTGIMRNGEQLRPGGATVAVDDSEWAWLQGKHLLILSDTGRYAVLRVTDTGYLYDAGDFCRSAYSRYFVPVDHVAAIGPRLHVVVDIPERTFFETFGVFDTQRVWAWVIE
jgi:hypothetical protein